ncbi:MAG: tubulin-like doman-containing protein [Tannerellaceae bacterium]|jgi:hypothetical protein|nr:tubulin-like doman-containing protein [Tannerellaceae bacterium]
MENHILIGLGGTGGKVLKEFRKRLFAEFKEDERKNLPIGFFYVDSTDEMMKPNDITFRVQGQDASFNVNEFVNIKGIELDTVFENPGGFPGLSGFIGDPEVMQKTIGTLGAAAGQKRRAGRILFGASIQSFLHTLSSQHMKVVEKSGKASVTIHIFTGLAGGTGSGSIIDVITQTRNKFSNTILENRQSGADIVVYCMVPEKNIPPGCDAGRYQANGYAALTELSALLVKKYLPYDVTGWADRVSFATQKVVNGMFVYSNINEHGKVLDSFKSIPKVVSDFAFSRIFLEQNDNTEDFNRFYSFENFDDFLFENNERVKRNEIDLIRSKTFGSFGIKRIVIPEEEIIEYFTYNFGRQALLQLRFNHWSDGLGFRDVPAHIDFNSYVKEPEQLERWRITDQHLKLDKPILDTDQRKWNGIADYWNNVIPAWVEQSRNENLPLNRLELFCKEGYEKFFRRVGVKNFYDDKLQAKEEHAEQITDIIERFIFDKWTTGDLSLFDLTKLIDKIIESISQRRRDIDGKITTENQTLEQLENVRKINLADWSNLGLIGGLIKKNKIIQRHATILSQYYIKRTEIEGLNFSTELLVLLLVKLNTLRTRIEHFINIINIAIEETDKNIGVRLQDNGTVSNKNLQEAIVRFYNNGAVKAFTKNVILDKKRNENIASEFRGRLNELIGSEHTFIRANAEISVDTIFHIFDTSIREKAISIHNEIFIEDHEKLINRNIIQQLSEKYNTEDDLKTFARNIIEQCGVFTTVNRTEIQRAIANNAIPKLGISIFNKIILINLPAIEGNETVQEFANTLETTLVNAVESGTLVKVDKNGTRKNEIAILSIINCFPLRILQDLPLLKEKYDYLINNPNEARQNRTVLHTEGTGENFPNLFVAKELLPSDIRKKYLPYLILAYAMGFVKYTDKNDGTGNSAYGTIEINRLGRPVLNPIAEKFIEIPFMSNVFTEAFGEYLREKSEKELKDKYLHRDRQAELIIKIQQLYSDIIIPEFGGNEGMAECQFFGEQAVEAIGIIEKTEKL